MPKEVRWGDLKQRNFRREGGVQYYGGMFEDGKGIFNFLHVMGMDLFWNNLVI